jgi:hypothetical protein
MHQVIDTYEKWCLRLSTSRLNRWVRKVNFWLTIAKHGLCVCNAVGRTIYVEY